LYIELNETTTYLESQLKNWERCDRKAQKTSNFFRNDTLTQEQVDSTMLSLLGYYKFNLKNSKFNTLVSSEWFEFKKWDSLKIKVLDLNNSYNTLLACYQDNDKRYHNFLQPYLAEHYSYRNFNTIITGEKAAFRVDAKKLLNDVRFANLIQNVFGSNRPFVMRLRSTMKEMKAFSRGRETTYPSITVNHD